MTLLLHRERVTSPEPTDVGNRGPAGRPAFRAAPPAVPPSTDPVEAFASAVTDDEFVLDMRSWTPPPPTCDHDVHDERRLRQQLQPSQLHCGTLDNAMARVCAPVVPRADVDPDPSKLQLRICLGHRDQRSGLLRARADDLPLLLLTSVARVSR